jgi:hypothetical protein
VLEHAETGTSISPALIHGVTCCLCISAPGRRQQDRCALQEALHGSSVERKLMAQFAQANVQSKCDAHSLSRGTQVRQETYNKLNRIEEHPPKLRLRFMFHYRSFPERPLVPLPPSAGLEAAKAQPQGLQ